ncbi:hypothetical protein BC940DRAFT_297703 [Gongronella butleri]|nr:hypothetical protein BC940DRAFT_297703 [Gongronella butleri]
MIMSRPCKHNWTDSTASSSSTPASSSSQQANQALDLTQWSVADLFTMCRPEQEHTVMSMHQVRNKKWEKGGEQKRHGQKGSLGSNFFVPQQQEAIVTTAMDHTSFYALDNAAPGTFSTVPAASAPCLVSPFAYSEDPLSFSPPSMANMTQAMGQLQFDGSQASTDMDLCSSPISSSSPLMEGASYGMTGVASPLPCHADMQDQKMQQRCRSKSMVQPTKTHDSPKKSSHQRGNSLAAKSMAGGKRRNSVTSLPGFSSNTHVLRWAAVKRKPTPKKKEPQPRMKKVNQEPQVPLDHNVVMDALRAKLLGLPPPASSSSTTSNSSNAADDHPTISSPNATTSASDNAGPSSSSTSSLRAATPDDKDATTPSPHASSSIPASPRSPPVYTHPTTGILYLDIKQQNKHSNSST